MPTGGSDLDTLKNLIESIYFSYYITFTNMDHLFWKVQPTLEDHHFAGILWYIWKARNNKDFSSLDIDPRDTLQLAETKTLRWNEAQSSLIHGIR